MAKLSQKSKDNNIEILHKQIYPNIKVLCP